MKKNIQNLYPPDLALLPPAAAEDADTTESFRP